MITIAFNFLDQKHLASNTSEDKKNFFSDPPDPPQPKKFGLSRNSLLLFEYNKNTVYD